jgi:hypothetical protein
MRRPNCVLRGPAFASDPFPFLLGYFFRGRGQVLERRAPSLRALLCALGHDVQLLFVLNVGEGKLLAVVGS